MGRATPYLVQSLLVVAALQGVELVRPAPVPPPVDLAPVVQRLQQLDRLDVSVARLGDDVAKLKGDTVDLDRRLVSVERKP